MTRFRSSFRKFRKVVTCSENSTQAEAGAGTRELSQIAKQSRWRYPQEIAVLQSVKFGEVFDVQ